MRRRNFVVLSATVLISCCLLLSQDSSQTPDSQTKPTDSDLKSRDKETTPAKAPEPSAPATSATAPPALPRDPEATAWELLDQGVKDDKTADRATAIRVLGLIPNDVHAVHIAEAALTDDKPEVRTAAAVALGQMQSQSSIPKLKGLLSDDEISVALAAANALESMHDSSGYQVYYEILTGERKASKGVVAEQVQTLKDPKKLAMIGFEEGIGFVPFAGIGWEAYRRLGKDDGATPVRAAAAKQLASDPDPASTRALSDAVKDAKNWVVRAAALEAIAKRGDPAMLPCAELAMSDEEKGVKYTAAAAVLHLIDVKNSARPPKKVAKKKDKKEISSSPRSRAPQSGSVASVPVESAR
jgi:HEAT repeat protein